MVPSTFPIKSPGLPNLQHSRQQTFIWAEGDQQFGSSFLVWGGPILTGPPLLLRGSVLEDIPCILAEELSKDWSQVHEGHIY